MLTLNINGSLQALSFTLTAPLEIYATLQRLRLAPSRSIVPDPRALIPFTSRSPFQPLKSLFSYRPASCVVLFKTLVFSPLSLCCILFYGKMHADQMIYTYMTHAFPKPEYPDAYSVRVALEDELDNDMVPGLGFTSPRDDTKDGDETDLFSEAKRKLLAITEGIRDALTKWLLFRERKGAEKGNRTDLGRPYDFPD